MILILNIVVVTAFIVIVCIVLTVMLVYVFTAAQIMNRINCPDNIYTNVDFMSD